MADKRRLKNWLSSFMEWTLPRSMSPASLLQWSGLFTLSTMMKRKVWWSRELLGSYDIYPNLYVVFVGDPAVVFKSTTIGQAETLLTNVGVGLNGNSPVTFAGDVTSHSKLLDALANSPDASVAIVSSEFSSLLQTTPEAMYEILTDIFDNKPKLSWSTWSHGDKVIEKPVVNLIAATTPAWISQQPPEYFVGGGFASRILFLFEEEPRQREIYYDHVDSKAMEKLKEDLTHDLDVISHIEGTFSHDSKKTKEHIRAWYKSMDTKAKDSRLKGYFGRKHLHAHKIAMLLSLCERDDRKITLKHWKEALGMLDYIEKKMPRAFATLGVNPFAVLMNELLAFVKMKESVNLKQVAGRFYQDGMQLEQLRSALAFLATSGKIKISGTNNDPIYRFLED